MIFFLLYKQFVFNDGDGLQAMSIQIASSIQLSTKKKAVIRKERQENDVKNNAPRRLDIPYLGKTKKKKKTETGKGVAASKSVTQHNTTLKATI